MEIQQQTRAMDFIILGIAIHFLTLKCDDVFTIIICLGPEWAGMKFEKSSPRAKIYKLTPKPLNVLPFKC